MQEIEFKTVLLGDSNVGKSSIMKRFVENVFDEQSRATVGTAYMTKKIDVGTRQVNFQIWDTAGQETFRSLQKIYYKDSNVAVLVYDITKKDSFNGIRTWYDELQNSCDQKKLVVALVGNKCDLIEREEVSYEEARAYAKQISGEFLMTSAKTGVGIEFKDLFTRLGMLLSQREKENPNLFKKDQTEKSSVSLQTGKKVKEKKKCC